MPHPPEYFTALPASLDRANPHVRLPDGRGGWYVCGGELSAQPGLAIGLFRVHGLLPMENRIDLDLVLFVEMAGGLIDAIDIVSKTRITPDDCVVVTSSWTHHFPWEAVKGAFKRLGHGGIILLEHGETLEALPEQKQRQVYRWLHAKFGSTGT